jgi:hypothetical protein
MMRAVLICHHGTASFEATYWDDVEEANEARRDLTAGGCGPRCCGIHTVARVDVEPPRPPRTGRPVAPRTTVDQPRRRPGRPRKKPQPVTLPDQGACSITAAIASEPLHPPDARAVKLDKIFPNRPETAERYPELRETSAEPAKSKSRKGRSA